MGSGASVEWPGAHRPSPVDSISCSPFFQDRTSMPRFMLLAATALLAAATALAQPAAQRGVGVDRRRHRQGRRARRRLRSLCQRRLARGQRRSPPTAPASAPSSPPPCWSSSATTRSSPAPARGNPAAGTNERRIADYYAAYLDRATIDRRGVAPLQPHPPAHRRHLEPARNCPPLWAPRCAPTSIR